MQIKIGAFVGNGVSGRAMTGLGFQPDAVLTKNTGTAADTRFRTKDMSSTNSIPLRNDVAGDATGIRSLDADGFTLGDSDQSNGNNNDYVFIALKIDGTANFTTFTYTGTGVDNRTVTGFGFQPDFVLIKGDYTNTGTYRYSTAVGDNSSVFYGGTDGSGRIKSLDANGITLGTDDSCNRNGIVYYGIAFKNTSNQITTFDYAGNGTDNRNITTPGFYPAWTWIKAYDQSYEPCFRVTAHNGDASQNFDGAVAADQIQALSSNGFQLGTGNRVNNNTANYHAFVVYDSTSNKLEALTDNFNDNSIGNTSWAKFEGGSATVTEQNAQLEIALPAVASSSTDGDLTSNKPYDLTASYAFLRVIQILNSATSADAELRIYTDSSNWFRFVYEAGTLYLQRRIAASTTTVTSFAFNSTTHAWWRIRESAGDILWDTSTDGVTWTNRATYTYGISILYMRVFIGGTCFQAEALPGNFFVDNFNVAGIATGGVSGYRSLLGVGI